MTLITTEPAYMQVTTGGLHDPGTGQYPLAGGGITVRTGAITTMVDTQAFTLTIITLTVIITAIILIGMATITDAGTAITTACTQAIIIITAMITTAIIMDTEIPIHPTVQEITHLLKPIKMQ